MTGSTVGIREIAAAAGVSIATVSRHLSGKTIRPAYRARVEEALSRLDYRPNLAARRLRSGDAGLIGLIVFGQSRTTAEERSRGFTDRIASYNLPLSIVTVPHDSVARRLLVRTTIEVSEVGAVVCGDSLILLDAAIALGESPGRAVRLAGFDAAEWQRLVLLEPIVIVQPVEEIAHAALALLIARMAGDEGGPTTVTFGGWIAPANAPAPTDQTRNR